MAANQDMAAWVMLAAQKLADEFQKRYGALPVTEKILAVIEKRAKPVWVALNL